MVIYYITPKNVTMICTVILSSFTKTIVNVCHSAYVGSVTVNMSNIGVTVQ